MNLFQILYPIEWVVGWIMYLCHEVLTFFGMRDGSGPAWVISIIGLVIVIRVLLIPLFFRQIRASRAMQMLQPELQAIQKKYKGKTDPSSREAMSRETMELYRKHGTNPFSSCMPILLQSPIFLALYRVLYYLPAIASHQQGSIGPITASVAHQIENSTFFGARLSDIFLRTDNTQTKIVTAALIIAMCATTFFTQRQLTMKNMPPTALEGPMASTQKMILYVYPVIFAFTGVNIPVGVLIYWTTTNLWSMGQQFYTIRRHPAPGSEAEKLMKEREAHKAARHHHDTQTIEDAPAIIEEPRGQRQQPKRQTRQQRQTAKPIETTDSTTSGPSASKPVGKTSTGKPTGGASTSPSRGTPAADDMKKPPRGKAGRSDDIESIRPKSNKRPKK